MSLDDESISKRKQRQLGLRNHKKEKTLSDAVTDEYKCEEDDDIKNQDFVSSEIEETENKGWAHSQMAPMNTESVMHYCQHCGFPPDFCEFGTSWELCKPLALSKYQQYYSHYLASHPEEAAEICNRAAEAKTLDHDTAVIPPNAADAMVTQKTRKKKEIVKQVTIQRVSRAKHKVATVVYGLDVFDVKLEDAAKKFKKRFACGSSAVKGLAGQANHVELQGDFENELSQVILSNFPQVNSEENSSQPSEKMLA